MVAIQYPVRPALRYDEEDITGCIAPWILWPIEAWTREPLLHKSEAVQIDFYAQPWMLKAPQAILSNLDTTIKTCFCVPLDKEDDLVFRIDAARLNSGSPLDFAASSATKPLSSSEFLVHFFNGRINSPTFQALGKKPLDITKYDFSMGLDTNEIFDVSGSRLSGILVNAPTRAVRGHDYDHKLIGIGWKEAKHGFVYRPVRSSFRRAQDTEPDLKDAIVFSVRPKEVRPQAKVAFIFFTSTYLAYANE
ncbi:hypothetical protein N0V84_008022 [Fusarium piperis]|uniref:Uncharacterized protein n=1 Tax=Fusarium piperis TaxID=1435070 RepID=A0A9W8W8Y8_9HYPO|nr:hypothetical protein N0V84_008022 [Fusarium piperis]